MYRNVKVPWLTFEHEAKTSFLSAFFLLAVNHIQWSPCESGI